jgi:hypothetical protein
MEVMWRMFGKSSGGLHNVRQIECSGFQPSTLINFRGSAEHGWISGRLSLTTTGMCWPQTFSAVQRTCFTE